jgi:hypothetical protein
MKHHYTHEELRLGGKDGLCICGFISYAINGPYDRYNKAMINLGVRFVRECAASARTFDCVRRKYKHLNNLAFKRYLADKSAKQ